jgi:hypothetical protein
MAARISRAFVEIGMQFWYYGTRIERDSLRKKAWACRNAIYEVKWEIPPAFFRETSSLSKISVALG